MTDATSRFNMPLLASGQAQKEVTHNEALALVDVLTSAVVESMLSTPPTDPNAGQGWIIGTAPTGSWSGREGSLAFWTGGGWRFIVPPEGMKVWMRVAELEARRAATQWELGIVSANEVWLEGVKVVGPQLPAIADPATGTVIDAEARAVIGSILERMRSHGLIAA